jgi:hypothetical protein
VTKTTAFELLREARDEEFGMIVDLVGDCIDLDCLNHAHTLEHTLRPIRYQQGVSLMSCPGSLDEWRTEHRTARKRADRCARRGYTFSEISYADYADDIFEINTSLEQRQGRPMADGYRERREHGRLPEFPCHLHNTRTYGVLRGRKLRAYLTLHRSNELGMVSMILGHGDHLADEIMYLLFAGMVEDQAGNAGILYYNRHDSGQDGLRFYKERVGFAEGDVAWSM